MAELGAEAQLAAFKRAGSLQKRAADSINGFANSVESAGKVFADKQSARAARLLQEGAVALRDLAGSLSEKPIADVVEDVRVMARGPSGDSRRWRHARRNGFWASDAQCSGQITVEPQW